MMKSSGGKYINKIPGSPWHWLQLLLCIFFYAAPASHHTTQEPKAPISLTVTVHSNIVSAVEIKKRTCKSAAQLTTAFHIPSHESALNSFNSLTKTAFLANIISTFPIPDFCLLYQLNIRRQQACAASLSA